jgi:hypothetical protein
MNGWPNPLQIGVPPNPGWYWLLAKATQTRVAMDWNGEKWQSGFGPAEFVGAEFTLLGPVATPEELLQQEWLNTQHIEALQERITELERVLRLADRVIDWTGADLLSGNPYGNVERDYKEARQLAQRGQG